MSNKFIMSNKDDIQWEKTWEHIKKDYLTKEDPAPYSLKDKSEFETIELEKLFILGGPSNQVILRSAKHFDVPPPGAHVMLANCGGVRKAIPAEIADCFGLVLKTTYNSAASAENNSTWLVTVALSEDPPPPPPEGVLEEVTLTPQEITLLNTVFFMAEKAGNESGYFKKHLPKNRFKNLWKKLT